MQRRLPRITGRTFVVALAVTLAGSVAAPGPTRAYEPPPLEVRKITFPVQGPHRYANDFGAPRSGGRSHLGIDIFGAKLQHLVAAVDGRITWVIDDSRGNSGNALGITDEDGWRYLYMHINNDTPGTDDGANPPQWRFAPGIEHGARVKAGQHIAYLGDSGNAENTSPHLHFEIRRPDNTPINPFASLRLSQGQRVGDLCAFDTNPPRAPDRRTAGGYWVLGGDGGVFTFGAAGFLGSTGAMRLNAPVIGMTPSVTGRGYRLLAADGGIFTFGDATFHGSTGAMRLNQPVVGMAPTPSGRGYWLVARDGGIFTFGDAGFHGSTGAMRLNQPIVAMAPTPSGRGYLLLAADGGLFTFGDARFHGSLPGTGLCEPPRAVAIAVTPTGGGYWIATADGGLWAFGDAWNHGSLRAKGVRPAAPIVGFAPTT